MTNPLDDLAAGIDPAQMDKAKISLDAFIAAYNLRHPDPVTKNQQDTNAGEILS